jgi:hypothetical protein
MIRVAGTSTVDLRTAEFSDVHRLTQNQIERRTRVGELKYARPSTWFSYDSYAITVTCLTQAIIDDFMELMIDDAGLSFTVSRIEDGSIWSCVGFITTPVFDIVRVRPPCWYDVNFEFRTGTA